MPIPIKLIFFHLALFISVAGSAQAIKNDKGCKPPKSRELWHDYVDREQKNALKAASNAMQAENEQVNFYVTEAVEKKIDQLQCKIESDTAIADQKKVGYLRGLEKFLKNFTSLTRIKQFNPSQFPTALSGYQQALELDVKGESIEFVIDKLSYEVGKTIVESGAYDKNSGFQNSKHNLLKKYFHNHPEKVFITLKDNSDFPYRDSFIKVAGYKYPRQLYDYSAAENRLGYAIRNMNDSFIQTIVKMARSKSGSGQLYFPFLDNILRGVQSFQEIDDIKNDQVKYYKLLVKTKLDYVHRQLEGEKIQEIQSLNAMLEKKAIEIFIKEINDLHDRPDPVRFKILQQLTSQELYYLAIHGERDLYTSSYTRGVYPTMMQKIGNRGDSLLLSVGFNSFKKFIKLAAGYNTLSNFLSSFPEKDAAKTLMTAFVNGLEKSSGLEDGVDVADSYASISENMKGVAEDMLNNVKYNYELNVKRNNKRGIVIYDLLYKLFLSSTDSSIDLSKEFNIPPVYSINYHTLTSDSGAVIMQVFFYGDEDGRYNYSRFTPQFPANAWKRTENKYWVNFTSTKGKKVIVYANKPLSEETGEVDKAQEALCRFLEEKEINPTIVIHRGHSYYAPYTIDQLPSSAKLVFLGSCGGYHLIHDVLRHASDAHIIASKQTGRQVINQPFFDLLNEKMLNGNNIEWIPFWKEFEKKSGKFEGFADYIPPHKNLGAIFIKAYKNRMGENSDQDVTVL